MSTKQQQKYSKAGCAVELEPVVRQHQYSLACHHYDYLWLTSCKSCSKRKATKTICNCGLNISRVRVWGIRVRAHNRPVNPLEVSSWGGWFGSSQDDNHGNTGLIQLDEPQSPHGGSGQGWFDGIVMELSTPTWGTQLIVTKPNQIVLIVLRKGSFGT